MVGVLLSYVIMFYILIGFLWCVDFLNNYYGTIKIKGILCMIIFLPQSILIGTYKVTKFILNKEVNLR